MSDQESVWYYTQNGERKGPVTLQLLKNAIEHNKIERATDLVWGPGLPDWVKIDEVPALQVLPDAPLPVETIDLNLTRELSVVPAVNTMQIKNKPAVAVAAATPEATPAANPYQAPQAEAEEEYDLDSILAERRGESKQGIGRLAYFMWNFVLTLVTFGVIGGAIVMMESQKPGAGAVVVLGGVYVVMIIASIILACKRLKNVGMSGWNYLWMLVPFMNIWLSFRIIACPAGYHQHRKLDLAGKIWVGVLVLYFIVVGVFAGVSSYKEVAAAKFIEQSPEAELLEE